MSLEDSAWSGSSYLSEILLHNTFLIHTIPAPLAFLFLKHHKIPPVLGHLYFLVLVFGKLFLQATTVGMLTVIRDSYST